MDVALSNTDRFIRNFVAVVDEATSGTRDRKRARHDLLEQPPAKRPATVLPKLIRTYPDVIVVRDVADLETLTILCEQAAENRLVITSTRAKEAVEALLRLMMLKIPPADFAPAGQRACSTCG